MRAHSKIMISPWSGEPDPSAGVVAALVWGRGQGFHLGPNMGGAGIEEHVQCRCREPGLEGGGEGERSVTGLGAGP